MSDRMNRKTVSAAVLHALLEEEVRRNRQRGCSRCLVPLPIFVTPRGAASPNWRVDPTPACDNGCHFALAEAIATLAVEYSIEAPPKGRPTFLA